MRTVDRIHIRAPMANAFTVASDVSRWPAILPHYRWVRFLERRGEGGVVEMAARRPFGPLAYPAWWVSEMAVDRPRGEIRYRHLQIGRASCRERSYRSTDTDCMNAESLQGE